MIHTLIKQLRKRKSGYLSQILFIETKMQTGLKPENYEIFEDALKANQTLVLQINTILNVLEVLAKSEIFKP